VKLPLIRQGEGAAGFQRILTEIAERQARIDQNIQAPADHAPSRATAAGDTRKLRGIPAIGRGVPGEINGTRP
jgi:hypothetical protein